MEGGESLSVRGEKGRFRVPKGSRIQMKTKRVYIKIKNEDLG